MFVWLCEKRWDGRVHQLTATLNSFFLPTDTDLDCFSCFANNKNGHTNTHTSCEIKISHLSPLWSIALMANITTRLETTDRPTSRRNGKRRSVTPPNYSLSSLHSTMNVCSFSLWWSCEDTIKIPDYLPVSKRESARSAACHLSSPCDLAFYTDELSWACMSNRLMVMGYRVSLFELCNILEFKFPNFDWIFGKNPDIGTFFLLKTGHPTSTWTGQKETVVEKEWAITGLPVERPRGCGTVKRILVIRFRWWLRG